jgi:lysophospholipase L1-like esterase
MRWILCLAAILCVSASPQHALRVLPLGDSITAGIVGNNGPVLGGYRAPLERLLAASDRDAVLVGTRTDYSPGMADPAHDGWPGYVIRSTSPGAPGQLYGDVTKESIDATHPDVILLMIGTNDFLRYEATSGRYSPDTMVESMDLLLQQIFSIDPHVRVIVGAIVNSPRVDACLLERFDTGRSSCDPSVHPSLASVVASYRGRGFAISYASGLMNALPRDAQHFPDGIHPVNGPDGYGAIARVWYQALEGAAPPH